jgi:DNA-directed RNA polymerase specialized sigma24 family protein
MLDRAIQLYESGSSLRETADEVGVTRSAVRSALVEAGVQMRPVGSRA